MKSKEIKNLVNFRLENVALRAFDDACTLSGSTRTAVLGKLIREFTAKAAGTIPKRIAEQKRSFKALRAAVERAHNRERADDPKSGLSALRARPLKRFAEFIADDPIGGRSH